MGGWHWLGSDWVQAVKCCYAASGWRAMPVRRYLRGVDWDDRRFIWRRKRCKTGLCRLRGQMTLRGFLLSRKRPSTVLHDRSRSTDAYYYSIGGHAVAYWGWISCVYCRDGFRPDPYAVGNCRCAGATIEGVYVERLQSCVKKR